MTKRAIWPVVAIVAVFALGAVTALAITDHAEQRAIIRAQAQMSAATTITIFLAAVILVPAMLAVGVVGLSCWLRGYQEHQKMRKAVQQAQVYALLQGRSPAPRRPAAPGLPQAGGNTLVFPGSQQQTPQLTIEDLTGGQPTPLAGLLPPSDEWEVL